MDLLEAKFYKAKRLLGNGVPITSDSYTCIMCGEEYSVAVARCGKCLGTFFEFCPGYTREIEVPNPLDFRNLDRRNDRNKPLGWCNKCNAVCQCNATVSE